MFYSHIFHVWIRKNQLDHVSLCLFVVVFFKEECLIYKSAFFSIRKASGALCRVFLIFSFESCIRTNCSGSSSKHIYQQSWYLYSCISFGIIITLSKASSALLRNLTYQNLWSMTEYCKWNFDISQLLDANAGRKRLSISHFSLQSNSESCLQTFSEE